MKLLTHNFMGCNIKGVKNGYPLKIEAAEVDVKEADLDPDFVKKMMGRVNYGVLKAAAEQLGVQGLPASLTTESLDNVDIVQKLHHSLLEVHLEEGALVCPETGRRFPVSRGIPNMLLNDDEV